MTLFINMVYAFIMQFLDGVEIISSAVDLSVLNPFLDICGTVLYFFPWRQIVPIISIIIALQGFRVTVSLLKTIMNILPFV